jgi:(1->4)-alpha-D-glucan 1-alpha-D-glucosylmutase
VSANRFHRHNLVRAQLWPGSMSASSTHDTKRSEDVRARMNALSEMPGQWYKAIQNWRHTNRGATSTVDGRPAPDSNEEYLLYQTLVGTWPLEPMNAEEHQAYIGRIDAYMQKALHEAKAHTSWINPHAEYEQAVSSFVQRILDPSPANRFLQQFSQFQAPIARAGIWNSLSQVLLKVAAPGVPDFYQGCELWAFDLVDPDNRRPVDYQVRRRILERFRSQPECDRAALVDRLIESPCDGAIKMFITREALRFRISHPALFSKGSYLSLAAEGDRAHHLVSFSREAGKQVLIALAGRFFLRLSNANAKPIDDVWADTSVVLPRRMRHRAFRDVFTGKEIAAQSREGRWVLPIAEAFAHCPVALLFAA